MNSTPTCYCKNIRSVFLISAGVILASVFLFPLFAKADEADFQSAISDLNNATDQNITTKEQALDFCNQEKYFDTCADIGKKHNLYTEEEIKQVDNFLSEVKGKILDDIKNCADETCLIKAAEELAKKIQAKNPTLATSLNITTKVVEEKRAVIEAAKEVGVDFRDCEKMDPDTAPIDLLRKCAKLAKDSRVQKYIPEEKRALAAQFEDSATIKLREALAAGKYQCGDNTLEGCGNFCLNPAGAAKGAGISPVCAQIAGEIFGADGVKQLEAAHSQVGQVKDYYSKKFILTLPSGKELAGEGQIRSACDQAFSGRNLEIARACGSFAVKNGFVSQAEVDRGLKLMESFTQKGQGVDFDQCVTNPAACREFIPEDDRGRFDAGSQIFEIMRTEIGFDPSQCERGATDQTIGTKCFEGSKRALAKIESLGLAGQSQEARFIIEDIKRHLSEGERMEQRKGEFQQIFTQQGGPGGCKSEAECFNYCSNPTNGPECISFGSKHDVSGFKGREAVERFQEYNQNIQRPGFISDEFRGPFPPFPGQGLYPGFQPPGQEGFPPPGQIPGFTQPGPGFGPPPGVGGFYPGPGPVGPSPECFAAIQSGDFAKAKTVCYVPPQPTGFPTPQICPASPYVECPAGQYHESFRNADGCWIDGPCKTAPTYSPGPYPTYSPYPSGPYPTGSYPIYSPPNYGNWIKHAWKFTDGSESSSILNRTDGEYLSYIKEIDAQCIKISKSKFFWKSNAGNDSPDNWRNFGIPDCSGTASPPPTYSPYPTYSPGPGTGNCPAGYHYHGESGGFCMNDQENYGGTCYNAAGTSKTTCPAQPTYSPGPGTSSCSQSLIGLLGDGCHWMYSDSSGRGIYCDGPMSKSAKEGDTATTAGCTSPGGTYSPYPTGSYTYTPYPSCPSGQWWDYTTSSCKSTTTSSGTCPSGSHIMYVNNAGGYCMSDSDSSKCGALNSTSVSSFGSCSSYQGTTTYSPSPGTTYTYTPYPSCPSGQWWDPSISACKTTSPSDTPTGTYTYSPYPTSTYTYTPPPSCPSDQYWNGTACVSSTTTTYTPYPTTEYTPPPTCGPDQYWDGSACVTASTPPPSAPDPATECANSGGTWDGSTCVFPPPPTSSLYNQYIVAHCQQLGRTWNGKICQANGLFARFYENSGLANILRLFYLVP